MNASVLSNLGKRKKSTNTVDLDQRLFQITFYENPRWIFKVNSEYVAGISQMGGVNAKGIGRINFPQGSSLKWKELRRLGEFVEDHQIPLAEFRRGGKPIEPVLLEGSKKEREIKNILNRFDSACYRALKKQGGAVLLPTR